MPCRRGYGLPRRFAPRNDMQKHAACQHGNDVVPGEFAALFRIRRKYCPPPCPAAGVTDCHVASLLAMTGENLLRVRVCQEVLPESVLAPAETHLSSACHCEPVRTLVWQSVSPQRNLASLLLLGQIRMRFFVFARSTAFCYALPQGDADCHVASLLAMTEGGRPCTRRNASVFSMSLRTSAHTGVAIRSPRREA